MDDDNIIEENNLEENNLEENNLEENDLEEINPEEINEEPITGDEVDKEAPEPEEELSVASDAGPDETIHQHIWPTVILLLALCVAFVGGMTLYQRSQEGKFKTWQDAYIDYILNDPDKLVWRGCDLIYIDDDDIPELAFIGSSAGRFCKILTYKDGRVNVTRLESLAFGYCERENLLDTTSIRNGDLIYEFYSIIDGKLTLTAGAYGKETDYYGRDITKDYPADAYDYDDTGLVIGFDYNWNGEPMSIQECADHIYEMYDGHDYDNYRMWDEDVLLLYEDILSLLGYDKDPYGPDAP